MGGLLSSSHGYKYDGTIPGEDDLACSTVGPQQALKRKRGSCFCCDADDGDEQDVGERELLTVRASAVAAGECSRVPGTLSRAWTVAATVVATRLLVPWVLVPARRT